MVYIEGKLRTRSFEDKEGIKKYTTEVVAENFTLLGRKTDFENDYSTGRKTNEEQDGSKNIDSHSNGKILNQLQTLISAACICRRLFYSIPICFILLPEGSAGVNNWYTMYAGA